EAAGDDAAQLGVLRWVNVEHDQPLYPQALFGLQLTEPDDRAVLPASEQIAVPGDLHDVCVPRHDPVTLVVVAAGAARLGVPPDRCRAPQLRELLGWDTIGVEVGIGEVESGR